MSALSETVKAIALARLTSLGFAAEDVNAEIDIVVDDVAQSVCNYCNISEVPLELRYVWSNMVVDYFRWLLTLKKKLTEGNGNPGESSTSTVLTSIKEGDTTLAFAADTIAQETQALNAHTLAGSVDRIVMNYTDQLNRFRKVVW